MRRIHVSQLSPGQVTLDESQSHHVRDVLRLKIGSAIELFDNAGRVGRGVIMDLGTPGIAIRIDSIQQAARGGELIVASAIPKGERADWMIEKLSELGVSRLIPLMTQRSVVHPAGKGKRDRWLRIATESAKQSRRSGVMRIDELVSLGDVLGGSIDSGWYLSTADVAIPVHDAIARGPVDRLSLFIGPEGGWSDAEIAQLSQAGLTGVKLTATILRVETAAICAAAIASTLIFRGLD